MLDYGLNTTTTFEQMRHAFSEAVNANNLRSAAITASTFAANRGSSRHDDMDKGRSYLLVARLFLEFDDLQRAAMFYELAARYLSRRAEYRVNVVTGDVQYDDEAFHVPEEIKKELDEFEDAVLDLLDATDVESDAELVEWLEDNPTEVTKFLKKIPWRVYEERQPTSVFDWAARGLDTLTDKFVQITGWKKLMSLSIFFQRENKISVMVVKHSQEFPVSEYIRLWLQYLAHVCQVLEREDSDDVEILIESICESFDSWESSETNAATEHEARNTMVFQSGTTVAQNEIRVEYYGRSTNFRLIKPNFGVNCDSGTLAYSVLFLLQYTIETIKNDEVSLRTLHTCCALWQERYFSVRRESVTAVGSLPRFIFDKATEKF